jgi:predicted RNA methylase
MPADYQTAITCLQENIRLMTFANGSVSSEDRVLWNLSNALLVICDGLRHLEDKLQS